MGKVAGFARFGVPSTMGRRLASPGKACFFQGGSLTAGWAAASLSFPGLPEAGPSGTWAYNVHARRFLQRAAPAALPLFTPVSAAATADTRSMVTVGGFRVTNGRGADIFDGITIDQTGCLTPFSLKGGKTAGDVALGRSLEMVKAIVASDAPLWVGVLTGGYVGQKVAYKAMEPLDLPAPTGVMVQWLNLTPLLKGMASWEPSPKKGQLARVRLDNRWAKDGDGRRRRVGYHRLWVNFSKIDPSHYSPKEPWAPDIMLP